MDQRDALANLKYLYAMEVFSGLSRGSYLVCIGWTTLVVTEDVARVGQVFIVAMLTTLLAGPFTGTIVDRHSRKMLVILAHLGIAACMLVLGLIWLDATEPGVALLFLMVIAVTALRMLQNSSHDGLIQGSSPPRALMTNVARFRGVHLVATAIGTVLTGFVIEASAPTMGFVVSALASILLVVPMVFVRDPGRHLGNPDRRAFLGDLKGGLRIFVEHRSIRFLAFLAGVSLPVGQLANAVLSSLIRDDLGLGSDAFGIVDASWALGGMVAALVLSAGIARLSAPGMEYIFAAIAGLATLALSFGTSVMVLAMLHGAMGLTVWLGRIVIDGRVLHICDATNIGRTKAGIEMVFAFSAMVMCLSPTVVDLPSASGYFLFWGALAFVVSLALWATDRVSARIST